MTNKTGVLAGAQRDISVTTKGYVGRSEVELARGKLLHVISRVPNLPAVVECTLTRSGNPSVSEPAMAHASIELNGELVVGHAEGMTMSAAVHLLAHRLDQQILGNLDRKVARRHPPT